MVCWGIPLEDVNCGTAYTPTCDRPRPEVCIQQCFVGCQCKNGLLRNSAGRCIRPDAASALRTSFVVIRYPSLSARLAANSLAATSQSIHSLLTTHNFGCLNNGLLKSGFGIRLII
uniref:TIL domain-containing protein n=1 Tax=Glossina pallidipes TaxID=7398 RepID=A0A1B0A950_GLOPL